jgi:hypothetical protein
MSTYKGMRIYERVWVCGCVGVWVYARECMGSPCRKELSPALGFWAASARERAENARCRYTGSVKAQLAFVI